MVIRILIAFFIFVIVALIALFFIGDIPREIAARKDTYENPLAFLFEERGATSTDSGFGISLEPITVPTIELRDTLGDNVAILADTRFSGGTQNDLREQERAYDESIGQLEEARVFGTPSPQRSTVSVSYILGGATASNADEEYVVITASAGNTAPIDITGWSLQSVVSGTRVFFPAGARTFSMGEVNTLSDINLAAGARAVISSGASPVGVSFQENICSGYLDQFQEFAPPLNSACPSPARELPLTAGNIQAYGDACIDFVAELPRCTLYFDTFPDDISSQCKDFTREALSYNGCVERHRWRPSFLNEDWRIFLGKNSELWRNSHDVIRLLDERGRTVDVLSY